MAHPWHDLPNNPDTVENFFNVVIEIPRGSRVKYELDKPSGMLRQVRTACSFHQIRSEQPDHQNLMT